MVKGEACGVCGETETRLVDGFYYCAECGTQDTNVQETIVEHTALADGTFGVARRTRYSVKIKEGVEMPPEWYKWHRHNFLLAGLTEQLIELGAAPSVRMKVLWIWTRYIKRYQKKDQMGPSQALNQLQDSSSSSEEEQEREESEDNEEELVAKLRKGTWALNRVSSYIALTILALALNIDRSPILVSHITRYARFRLLTVTDLVGLVPAEIYEKTRRVGYSPVRVFKTIPYLMSRLANHLELGPPVTPDIEQMLSSALRELRLPRGLGELVRALLRLAPVPFRTSARRPAGKTHENWRFPDYEATVMAYIVVALKMCFGLDDDYERRLSAAVERLNQESHLGRTYSSAPEPTERLFSFSAWAAHVQLRARLLACHYAPFAWLRRAGSGAGSGSGPGSGRDAGALDQLREFTSARAADHDDVRAAGARKGAKARVTDQVTMEILHKIPNRFKPDVLSLHSLRPAAAALEPQVAVARVLGPLLPPRERHLLDEDFTEYSLHYAYRHLALPGTPSRESRGLFRGVRRDRPCGGKFGDDIYSSCGDPTLVYIKNCPNRNWARTGRPTAAHVVADDTGAGLHCRETRRDERETAPETFDEEKEGRNIYDDDFADIQIKEEKNDFKDDAGADETKVETQRINGDNFESASRGSFENKSDDEVRDMFDSDEEAAPVFDPAAFDRREVIKEIMAASYKKLSVPPPVRFQTEKTVAKKDPKRLPILRNSREYLYGVGTQVWVKRQKQKESKANVDDIVALYRDNLHRDPLRQLQEHVRAFTAAADGDVHAPLTPPPADPHAPLTPPPADPGHVSRSDAMDVDDGDVEIIENDGKNYENIEDDVDEHAYDPIFKSDPKFDEKTHDVEQLYLKMTEAPPRPRHEPPGADVTAIIDKQIRRREKKTISRKQPIVDTTDIDHLVDDPERIDGYNYWVTRIASTFGLSIQDDHRRLERAIEERCPRSFWLVLRECAAALALRPAVLFRRVADVEAALFRRELHVRVHKPTRGRGRPRKHHYDLPDASDSRASTLGGPGSHSKSRLQEGGTALQNREPRKRGRPRIPTEGNLSVASDSRRKPDDGKAVHDRRRRNETKKPRKIDSESSEWRESTSEYHSSSSDSSPEIKKIRRKHREPFDGNLSVSGDSQKTRTKMREDGSTARSQQNQKKRGIRRKNLIKDLSEESDSQESTPESPSSYSDWSEEDETVLRKPQQPGTKGGSRRSIDGNLSVASHLEKKPEDQNEKKRGRPRRSVDVSELSDSQESTPSGSADSD